MIRKWVYTTSSTPKRTVRGNNKLNLETTNITGNRELPKVLYIVPWKKSEIGEMPMPTSTALDDVLTPIDREVFRREVDYYYYDANIKASDDAANPRSVPVTERR